MKNLFKLAMVFLFAISMASCGNTCYDCTGYDDGTVSLDDLGEICVGDPNDNGGELTKSELDDVVSLYELLGGTCTKK